MASGSPSPSLPVVPAAGPRAKDHALRAEPLISEPSCSRPRLYGNTRTDPRSERNHMRFLRRMRTRHRGLAIGAMLAILLGTAVAVASPASADTRYRCEAGQFCIYQ